MPEGDQGSVPRVRVKYISEHVLSTKIQAGERPVMTTSETAGELLPDLRLQQDAKAQREAWAPSTHRTYRPPWKTFTGWCGREGGREGLSARPADPAHVAARDFYFHRSS